MSVRYHNLTCSQINCSDAVLKKYNKLNLTALNPRYTATAAVSLAVSARTSDCQTLRHGVSLSAWYRPWILLGGLQARVRDLFSPATAFSLQYRRRGSCHMPVFTWRPRIPGRRSSSVECATAQYHLCTISVLILGLCGFRGCKNGPAPFPGQMSYKATKPGLVCLSYLNMFFIVLLFIRAPFYVLLVFIVCVLSFGCSS